MSKQYRTGIDPGHGGFDPGAVGRVAGLLEKNVTLAISLELARLLRYAGQLVFMTRTTDSAISGTRDTVRELEAKVNILNNAHCDLVVSVHCNSNKNTAPNYIATYVQGTGGGAEKIAKCVQPQLVKATGWPDGGVKVSNLYMIRKTKMPAILCECGFISNSEQEKQLSDPAIQKKLAAAIARGLMDYLGIEADQASPLDDALKILVSKGVILSADYWMETAPGVKYLDALLINMAKKLEGGK